MNRPLLLSAGIVLFCTAAGDLAAADRTFTLEAHMTGYIGVEGDIAGKRNPTLAVEAGDTVKLVLVNAEPMAHDISLDAYQLHSSQVLRIGDRTTLTIVAKGSDTYYCSIPGHRQIGMEGRLEVKGGTEAKEEASGSVAALHAPMPAAAIEPAHAVSVNEIGADPTAIPAPITRAEPAVVPVRITASEETATLAEGVTFDYWCYNKQVPGPLVRCRVGDAVDITFANDAKSRLVHSIDFHAASGPGGGAKYLQVAPGQEKELRFKALVPGLYIYHCATPHIPSHLSHGMYGMVLVEPEGGLPKVDHEFYVMQGEFYTVGRPGGKGHMTQDDQRLFDERPTFVCMNGRVGSLTGERTMKAKVGESVRILFGVGGPNLTSSFHVIGEIFDRVYREGDLISTPSRGVQTTLVPAGGATVVDLAIDTAGTYLLVDHSLSRLDKGCVGLLKAEGEDRPDIITLAK